MGMLMAITLCWGEAWNSIAEIVNISILRINYRLDAVANARDWQNIGTIIHHHINNHRMECIVPIS